jgi:hypothetical protein
VPLTVFRDFVAALDEHTVEITTKNINSLSQLCTEFGFQTFPAQLSAFHASDAFLAVNAIEDTEPRLQITASEERWMKHDHEIAGCTFASPRSSQK